MDLKHERNENFSVYILIDDLAMLYLSFITPKEKNFDRFIKVPTLPIQNMVTSIKLNTYNHAKRLAITLTNQWVQQVFMNKKRILRELWITKGITMRIPGEC